MNITLYRFIPFHEIYNAKLFQFMYTTTDIFSGEVFVIKACVLPTSQPAVIFKV